jgi:hypothetical protein
MLKITKAKKLALILGLGMGLVNVAHAARPNCGDLERRCHNGSAMACHMLSTACT